MKYITTGAVALGNVDGMLIQVNAALTGTFTLTAGGVTFAVITNPTVGSQFRYNGLRGQGSVIVTASTTCDATISLLNRDI